MLDNPGAPLNSGDDEHSDAAYHGYRTLTREQIANLAHQIVKQVKWRGPFTSLAAFVNRDPRQRMPRHLTSTWMPFA